MMFKPKSLSSVAEMKTTVERCLNLIKNWRDSRFLKLNPGKTEVMVLAAPHLSRIFYPSGVNIEVWGSDVTPTRKVVNFGVVCDQYLQFDEHVTRICQTGNMQLRNIFRIRKYLNEDAVKTLVHAIIISRLDCCNCLLSGVSQKLVSKLQRIQNTAARVVAGNQTSLISAPLATRLPENRTKGSPSNFKALNGLAPAYLSRLLHTYKPKRDLRSTSVSC